MCKRIIAALLSLVMLLSCIPVMAFAEGHPTATLTVSDIYTTPGSTVTIDVMIEDNPGILGATLKLSWNDGLILIGCENGTAFSELTFQKPSRYQNGCNFVWYGSSIAEAADGIILSLTFVVEENATDADIYDINITYGSGDVVDENYAPVDLTVKNGSIRIVTYTPGDVTGDGRVNTLDLIKLCQYISDDCVTDPEGFNVTLNESAADVNDDGKLNPLDLILISQYISDGCVTNPDGYNVTLKPSTPRCRHKMTKVDAKDATCTEEGNIEYWFCGECGKCFDSKGGNTELTLDDVVVAAKGHTEVIDEAVLPTYTSTGLSEGKHCSVCGFVIVPQEVTGPLTKDEYSIQYVSDIIPVDANGVSTMKLEDTYKPTETKVLQQLQKDKYKFLGWSDKDGKFYGIEIPKGTTDDLVLYANWASERNRAVPVSQLDAPIICEDSDAGQIIFIYEIGSIKNIPLFETQNLQAANGIITNTGIIKQNSISQSNAEEVGKIIANTTTNSSTWTFSKDWNEIMSVSEEWAAQQGMTLEEAQQFSQNSSQSYNVVNSRGGSDSTVKFDGSSYRIVGNQAHTESTYDEKQKYTRFNIDSNYSNTTNTSLGVNAGISAGIGMPLGPAIAGAEASVGAEAGISNTSAFDIGAGYDNQKYTKEIKTGTDSWSNHIDLSGSKTETTTNTKTWNDTVGFSGSASVSASQAISKAVSELISQRNSKDSSYSTGGEEGESKEYASSNAHEDKYSSSVIYSKEQIETTERSYKTSGDTIGNYRVVQTGTAHVFAVVAYDIKSSSYFVYTYSVLDDDEYDEYLDYSYDGSFNDYETSTLPFEIPIFVNDYVDSRIATSKLQISDDGIVTKYLGSADDEIVLIPSYYTKKNSTTGETEMIKVKGIAEGLFKNNTNIIGVSLGNFVNEIPTSAFEGCTALKEVICPNVVRIGANAFKGCTSLSEFALPNEIEHIGANAFDGVPAITSNAPTIEIANIVASSNVRSITLNISKIKADDFSELTLNIGQINSFKLLGNYQEYRGLNIRSNARETIISGITIPKCNAIPIRVSSDELTLERVKAYGEGFALVLEAANTTLSLEGVSELKTGTTNGILGRSITLKQKNEETYSAITVNGRVLVCGAVNNNDGYIETQRIVTITEEEYKNYLTARKVIFDANGGTVSESSRIVGFGAVIGSLPVPKRDGHEFDGWYTDSGKEVLAGTIMDTASDMTLRAKWKVLTYQAKWNTGVGYTITVERVASPYASAATGMITNGATVYHGDALYITYTPNAGYSLTSTGPTSVVVAGNDTADYIYATAAANSYTYTVVYQSSNGTPLGTSSCTYKYGTTNTVHAPAKTGYNAPASQSVKWDSTSDKTITFVYSPAAVEQTVKTDIVYSEDGSVLYYKAQIEYRNRTADSVQIRVVWTNTLTNGRLYNGLRFRASVGSVSTGDVDVLGHNAWKNYGEKRTVTKESGWITVPLSTTNQTSINVKVYHYQSNANGTDTSWDGYENVSATWAVAIPAY